MELKHCITKIIKKYILLSTGKPFFCGTPVISDGETNVCHCTQMNIQCQLAKSFCVFNREVH